MASTSAALVQVPNAIQWPAEAKNSESRPPQQNVLHNNDSRLAISIRTGCIPCRSHGVKCDPRNPRCELCISEDWTLNPTPPDHNTDASKQDESIPFASQTSVQTATVSSSWQKQGWRERHSLHFFATITAPRLAGSCHCNFWSSAVVQASFTEPVILHAIAASGALHEAMLRRSASQDSKPHNAKAHLFVMQQCRKVIGRLITKGRSKKSARDHSLVLTACASFSTIELSQDKSDDMATHGLQARKLSSGYGDESAISTRSTSSVSTINLANLQPVVERLASQSRIFVAEPTASPDGNCNTVDAHRPKPISPASVPSISSLAEAQHSLFRISMPTSSHQQTAFPCNRRTTAPRKSEHSRCERSSRDWERAFTAFLSSHVRDFTLEEVRQARVMKANHLYAHMVARIDASPQRGFDVWSYFIPGFEAIVHSAVAVLEDDDADAVAAAASTRYCKLNNDPSTSSEDEPIMSNPHQPNPVPNTSAPAPALSIIEPLYFTSLWCPSAPIRHRAIASSEACQRTPQPDARSGNEQWASWTPRTGTPRMAMAASRDVCVAISRDRVSRNLARPSYPTAVAVGGGVRVGRTGGGGGGGG